MNFYTLSYRFAGTLGLSIALGASAGVQAQTVSKVPSAVLTPFVAKVAVPQISSSTQTPAKVEIAKPVSHTESLHTVESQAPSLGLQHVGLQKTDYVSQIPEKSRVLADSKHGTAENHLKSEIDVAIQNLLGVKYKFGGNDPSKALDCSALILRIAEIAGQKVLPRTAKMMASSTKPVGKDEIRHGDLLFFNTRGDAHSHVGMYLGGGRFVHASSTKGKVTYSQLSNSYFRKRFTGARRIFH